MVPCLFLFEETMSPLEIIGVILVVLPLVGGVASLFGVDVAFEFFDALSSIFDLFD